MSSITGRLRSVHTLLALAGLAALLFVATGCGSGDSGSSSGGSASGGNADVTAAKQLIDTSATRPTQITQAKPIDKPIPTGKKITFISCGVEACAVAGPDPRRAAPRCSAGRSSRSAPTARRRRSRTRSSPPSATAPNAVIINAADKDALAGPISAAKSKGVEVVTCCSLGAAGQGRPVQHRHAGAERPDRQDARRQGRRRQRRQGQLAVRQRLGVRDPRGGRRDVRAGVQAALRRLRVRRRSTSR